MAPSKSTIRAAELPAAGLFSGLPLTALEALVSRCSCSSFSRGQTALRQGSRSDEVHLILSGAFKASRLTEEGNAVTLSVMGKGEVFGEMAFLDGGYHSANVTALMPSRTLRLSSGALESLIASYPSVRDYLAKLLAWRLRRLTTTSERMAVEDLASRLARQLLDLAERFGAAELGGTRILLELPQRELAELVCGTRERVNRILSGWFRQGLVELRGRHVVVLSRDALARCAGRDPAPSSTHVPGT